MLRFVYEATTNLNPGQLVAMEETRGRITVRLRAGAVADAFVPPLNAALERFVGQCTWFQIWRGQIISAATPDRPLIVEFEVDPEVDPRACVQIREDRGMVRLHVCPEVPAEVLVRALNPALENFLAGGQWFQLWQGEIVTMESPGSAAA
ncbi:hypothetical protein ACFWH4_00950 [Streptomyces sp. NPDC127091]|uniref:hypothetical protein n=1 Tax=Streptomyces sp. NPDC127091 TaxID=3347134 RepID=UPI003646FB4F